VFFVHLFFLFPPPHISLSFPENGEVLPVFRNTVAPGERKHSCVSPNDQQHNKRKLYKVSQVSIGNCFKQLLINFPVNLGTITKNEAQENTTKDKTSTRPNKQARRQRQLDKGIYKISPESWNK